MASGTRPRSHEGGAACEQLSAEDRLFLRLRPGAPPLSVELLAFLLRDCLFSRGHFTVKRLLTPVILGLGHVNSRLLEGESRKAE